MKKIMAKTTFKVFLEKVHQIGDRLPPRGAPEEKARAFDKVHRKRGPVVNRSVLRKMDRLPPKFQAAEYMIEDEYTSVLVMNTAIDRHDYYGVNVLFMDDGSIDLQSGDKWGAIEEKKFKKELIQTAKEALMDPSFEDWHGYAGLHSDRDEDDRPYDPDELIGDPKWVNDTNIEDPKMKKLVDTMYWNDRVPKAHRIEIRDHFQSVFDE